MRQEDVVRRALDEAPRLPEAPTSEHGEFLSAVECERIVAQTLEQLEQGEDPVALEYVRGHQKRLAHSLSMIPRAARPDAACLDVGCFGFMAHWAKAHLGYATVHGIEYLPGDEREVVERKLQLGAHTIEVPCFNFDITREWPLAKQYDTVLLLEVLEHINTDPMGVIERIHARLRPYGHFVMSVPNAISYKGLSELLSGMPPWTYWFYQPDLEHEPRHCFEYTPLVFSSLLIAGGFRQLALSSVWSYAEPEEQARILQVAELLQLERDRLGDTMIALTQKASERVPVRHPDLLYDKDGYYATTYPRVREQLEQRLNAILEPRESTAPEPEPTQALQETVNVEQELADRARTALSRLDEFLLERTGRSEAQVADAHALVEENARLRAELDELLFVTDCYLAERELEQVELQPQGTQVREPSGTRAELEKENADLKAQVQELLFTCDCYLQQINDPAHCSAVVRQDRFRALLGRAKATARKVPVVRDVLRPVYRRLKRTIKQHG